MPKGFLCLPIYMLVFACKFLHLQGQLWLCYAVFLISELPAQWSRLPAEADLLWGAASPLSLASKIGCEMVKGCAWLKTHFPLNSAQRSACPAFFHILQHHRQITLHTIFAMLQDVQNKNVKQAATHLAGTCLIHLTKPVNATYIDLYGIVMCLIKEAAYHELLIDRTCPATSILPKMRLGQCKQQGPGPAHSQILVRLTPGW